MKKQIAASLAIAALITACNVAPKILSVDDLVAALVDEGVAIDSQEPAPIPQ
jgi:hypothetical protein